MSNHNTLNQINVTVELTSHRKVELVCRGGYFCSIALPPSEAETLLTMTDIREISHHMTQLKRAYKLTETAYEARPKRKWHRRTAVVAEA